MEANNEFYLDKWTWNISVDALASNATDMATELLMSDSITQTTIAIGVFQAGELFYITQLLAREVQGKFEFDVDKSTVWGLKALDLVNGHRTTLNLP